MMLRLRCALTNEPGFSLIELLVAASLLTVGIISILSVLASSSNTATISRVRAVANNLAAEKIESARVYSYANITQAYLQTNLGTTVTRGGYVFTLSYNVSYVDDPANGTGAGFTNDYKKVSITVSWLRPKPADSILVETLINNNPVDVASSSSDTVHPTWTNGANVLSGTPQQVYPGLGIYLTWAPTAATDNIGIVGYLVYRKGPGDSSFIWIVTEAPIVGAYLDDQCTAGGVYQYNIKAYDAAGWTTDTASNTVTITAPSDTTPPTPPTGLVLVSHLSTSVTLSWNPSTDNSGVVDHYNIYRSHSGNNYNNTPDSASPTTTFSDYGLTTGLQYKYAVTAVDAAGNESGRSGDLFVTPQ